MTGRSIGFVLLLLLSAGPGPGADRLYLKTRAVETAGAMAESLGTPPKRRAASLRSHLLVQFPQAPSPGQIEELRRRGAAILGYVPESGLLISAEDGTRLDGLGLRWADRLREEDKLSPLLARADDAIAAPGTGAVQGAGASAFLVEFHPDVDPQEARALAREHYLEIRAHPDLLPNHLLVQGTASRVAELAGWDEVAYIYPASRALMEGAPVRACAGAATWYGQIGQYVARVGEGWDGPGQNAAELGYRFAVLTAKLPEAAIRTEILRALAQWSANARLNFAPAEDPSAPRTLSFLFASGAHGDPYPFDGRGRVLAHSFYPAPPNPEPIAGDIHFDADEDWGIGDQTDLFTIALHEAGHALGLGHSDQPDAVMYPYYRRATGLSAEDIAAIRELYAARDEGGETPEQPPSQPPDTPPAAPPPLSLAVQPPPAVTTAETISLWGASAGGTGEVRIAWRSDRGFSGAAQGSLTWTISSAPLAPGMNVITVTATDSAGAAVSQAVSILRQQVEITVPQGTDVVAPSLTILYPIGTSFLSYDASIVIRGTASDNVAVTEVTWSDSSGFTAQAEGTVNWTTGNIPLREGTNTIVLSARDAAGNVGWRSVMVTRRRR